MFFVYQKLPQETHFWKLDFTNIKKDLKNI